MLKEAKRLHDLGFAIHWLMSRSKRPIEKNWTTGPRATFKALEKSYKKGFNVGVRLGAASKLSDGTYLAVIDCDVKGSPEDGKELQAKLEDLGLDTDTALVISGRGNGSHHLYIRTPKPLAPRRLSQSSKIVKVLMPSSKPSTKDVESLSEKEIKEGFRNRPAWEISLMGEGQQVVLPPSIHPDTGAQYKWSVKRPFNILEDIWPMNNLESKQSEKIKKEKLNDFKPVEYDPETLPEEVKFQLMTGIGVNDRSAALFGVVMAMQRAGWEEDQILSALTDKENYLGETAYDHAKTESRRRAAEWILNFTLKKAKNVGRKDFDVVESNDFASDVIPESEALEVVKELVGVRDWRQLLERGGDGKPKHTLRNLLLIFDKVNEDEKFVAYDEFANEMKWLRDLPDWEIKEGHSVSPADCRRLKDILSKHYRMEPTVEKIYETLQIRADGAKFHPVKEYLETLEWDGVERVENWLIDYLGAHDAPKEYLRAVGLKTLVAMVARVYEPGIKFDHVLILEGKQGAGKSSAARILGDPWFSDTFLNVTDKDAVMNMQGVWINELGELSAMTKSEVNSIKEFIARQTDKIRPPFERLSMKFPRQNIFIGTTNNKNYLRDTTGNRRFWPVKISQLKRRALTRDRDQLLAEALSYYSLGEELFLKGFVEGLARKEQGLRLEFDELEGELQEFFDDPECPLTEFTFFELMEQGPKALQGLRNDRASQMRVAVLLKKIGYDNSIQWDKGTKKMARKWRKIEGDF